VPDLFLFNISKQTGRDYLALSATRRTTKPTAGSPHRQERRGLFVCMLLCLPRAASDTNDTRWHYTAPFSRTTARHLLSIPVPVPSAHTNVSYGNTAFFSAYGSRSGNIFDHSCWAGLRLLPCCAHSMRTAFCILHTPGSISNICSFVYAYAHVFIRQLTLRVVSTYCRHRHAYGL